MQEASSSSSHTTAEASSSASSAPTTVIPTSKLKAHKTIIGEKRPIEVIEVTPPTHSTKATTSIQSSSSGLTPLRIRKQVLSSDEEAGSDSTEEVAQNLSSSSSSSRQTMSPEGRLLQMNRAAIRRSRLKKQKTSASVLRPFVTFPYCPRSSIFVPNDSSKLDNFGECLVNQFDRVLSTLTLFAHTAIRNNNISLYERISSEISQLTLETSVVYKPQAQSAAIFVPFQLKPMVSDFVLPFLERSHYVSNLSLLPLIPQEHLDNAVLIQRYPPFLHIFERLHTHHRIAN